MTEKQAKRQLAKMLEEYTAGSVLHLLADICGHEARHQSDPLVHDQLKLVEHALVVVGYGIDAAQPRP